MDLIRRTNVAMPTSLFATDTQQILDAAKRASGTTTGPFPSPMDWRDMPIYFLMVDRFNNPQAAPKHAPFNDPKYFDFQGGTFSGIQQQLPYIKALGAKAIWLSPVLKNLGFDGGSYHGYGIHDFLRAEPRFAERADRADEELRALVDAAHKQGLYVIFDIVLNHTGNVFAYECDSDDQECRSSGGAEAAYHSTPMTVEWRDADGRPNPAFTLIENIGQPSLDAFVWPKELQRTGVFRRQGTPNGDDTIGDFSSLKQMMTADADVQRFLIRAYQYVVARFDVDGFRIDTLRYLKGDLPRLFGNAIREFALSIGKQNFFTFGEVLDPDPETDIAHFIGRNTGDASELVGVDAALDYPLFNNLKPVVKGFSAPSQLVSMYHRRKQIEKDILSSHGEATRFFVTFLDNHDMKERIRYVEPGNEHHYDSQVTLGLACLHALPGIPCLYYGTEQGLNGAGSDPAVREALWGGPGFSRANDFYREIQKIQQVRAERPALRYGRFYFRPVSGDGVNFGVSPYPGGVLAFSRILNDEEVLVVANCNLQQSQSLDAILEIQLSEVGARYAVLYSNKPDAITPSPVRQTGPVVVNEVDGSVGHGPLHVVRVTLAPCEVQILGR